MSSKTQLLDKCVEWMTESFKVLLINIEDSPNNHSLPYLTLSLTHMKLCIWFHHWLNNKKRTFLQSIKQAHCIVPHKIFYNILQNLLILICIGRKTIKNQTVQKKFFNEHFFFLGKRPSEKHPLLSRFTSGTFGCIRELDLGPIC